MKTITINIIAVLVAIVIIAWAVSYTSKSPSPVETKKEQPANNNVRIENGKQIIEITARGGYSPRKTIAKAGIPTIIRFNTNSTYDCSSAVLIPSLKIRQNLPSTGSTDIDIGIPDSTNLGVTCGMGMYSFGIDFQ